MRTLAEDLIAQHLEPGWTFDFDHARRRAGQCRFDLRRITLSRHLAARYDDDTNRQTILHEIAHALAGHAAGHGPRWKAVAISLGCPPRARHDGEVAIELAPWVGHCPNGHVAHRFRRPDRELSCARCSGTFSRAHLLVWRRREVPATR